MFTSPRKCLLNYYGSSGISWMPSALGQMEQASPEELVVMVRRFGWL